MVLLAGWLAVRVKPAGWRYVHLVAMLLSAYNLFGGAVNEAFLRIKPLRAIAGENLLASPVVGMTHGVVMMAFTLLIVGLRDRLTSGRSSRPRGFPAQTQADDALEQALVGVPARSADSAKSSP